jgi:hypothetical protein
MGIEIETGTTAESGIGEEADLPLPTAIATVYEVVIIIIIIITAAAFRRLSMTTRRILETKCCERWVGKRGSG